MASRYFCRSVLAFAAPIVGGMISVFLRSFEYRHGG